MQSRSNAIALFHALILAGISFGFIFTSSNSILLQSPAEYWMSFLLFLAYLFIAMVATLMGGNKAVVTATTSVFSFLVLTVHQPPAICYLTLAAMLFCIGVYGMAVSRNAIRVLMSIELMLNAVNLNMITFARYIDPQFIRGQIFAIFILIVAAAEAAVGLAIVLSIYRNWSSVDMEKFDLLKW